MHWHDFFTGVGVGWLLGLILGPWLFEHAARLSGTEKMGDSRASVKIELSIYGEKFETDMWINWFPEDSGGMDRRVSEWFSECYEKAYYKYRTRIEAQDRERNKAQIEASEKAQLKALQDKYPEEPK